MVQEQLQYVSALLLVSRNAQRLADFYRDQLNLPLKDEQHGDTAPHWGCTLGDLHFAIHPVEDFPDHPACDVGAVKLAFTVFDLAAYCQALKAKGVELLYEPRDAGFCSMAALRDPDGNLIELTQLRDDWFTHLERRRSAGHDVIQTWHARRGGASDEPQP